MKNIEKGKPLKSKIPLSLDDIKPRMKKVTITLDWDLHKKIKQRSIDTDIGVLQLVTDTVVKEFDK